MHNGTEPHADEKRQGEAGVENEDQDEQRDERAFPADRQSRSHRGDDRGRRVEPGQRQGGGRADKPADDGSFLAHVDLARLGTADRWADLAVMTLSLEWNYVGYDEADFWAAYGSEPDAHRIAYYRALWNAA